MPESALGETQDYRKLSGTRQINHLLNLRVFPVQNRNDVVYDPASNANWHVDKLLISRIPLPFFLSTVHKK